MERYFQSPNKKLWHIFSDRYAVEFTEDRLRIIHNLSFHEDKEKHGCAGQEPCHISADALPGTRLVEYLVNHIYIDLPILVELVGSNLGTVDGVTIGEHAEKGFRKRTIERVKCLVAVVEGDLLLDIEIGASAVHREKAEGELADWELESATYRYQPRIPAEYVAEFLNMTDRQKRQYARRDTNSDTA